VRVCSVPSLHDLHTRISHPPQKKLNNLNNKKNPPKQAKRIDLAGVAAHPWFNAPLLPHHQAAWAAMQQEQAALDARMAAAADGNVSERGSCACVRVCVCGGGVRWRFFSFAGRPAPPTEHTLNRNTTTQPTTTTTKH
jgi:hypothetical protein